jgi:hypothetical protein
VAKTAAKTSAASLPRVTTLAEPDSWELLAQCGGFLDDGVGDAFVGRGR